MNGVERNILLRRTFAHTLSWSLRRNFRIRSESARRDQSNAKEVQTEKKHLRENGRWNRVYLAEVATDARRDTNEKTEIYFSRFRKKRVLNLCAIFPIAR